MEPIADLSTVAAEPATSIPAGPGKTVLIVDDQADERTIQRAMLEHRGYRVHEAADGAEALELIASLRPDLILLDIAMPKMDGLTVCRTLKGSAETNAIVVLFYTASLEAEWQEEVEQAGAAGVLGKPLDPHRVADEIARLIGKPTD